MQSYYRRHAARIFTACYPFLASMDHGCAKMWLEPLSSPHFDVNRSFFVGLNFFDCSSHWSRNRSSSWFLSFKIRVMTTVKLFFLVRWRNLRWSVCTSGTICRHGNWKLDIFYLKQILIWFLLLDSRTSRLSS